MWNDDGPPPPRGAQPRPPHEPTQPLPPPESSSLNYVPPSPQRSSLREFRGKPPSPGTLPAPGGSASRQPTPSANAPQQPAGSWPGNDQPWPPSASPKEPWKPGTDAWPNGPAASGPARWGAGAEPEWTEWATPGPGAPAAGKGTGKGTGKGQSKAKASATGKGAADASGKKPRGGKVVALSLLVVTLLAATAGGVLAWPKVKGLFSHRATTTTANQFPWVGKSGSTPVNPAHDAFTTAKVPVDPAFTAYYKTHGNGITLGPALTPAFTSSLGLVQFFGDAALVSPGTPKGAAGKTSGDLAMQMVSETPTQIYRLPLVAALMAAGAKISIGPDSSNFTFTELRAAAQPENLVPGTAPSPTPPATTTTPVFVPVKTANGKTLGHTISPITWAYLSRNSAYPTGWQNDLGLPVTEPIAITGQIGKTTHHFTIQAFWNGVVIADADSLDATGAPKVWLENAGLDYLRTLGPPTPTVTVGAAMWSNGDPELLDAAGTGKPVAHLGPRFPVKLTGTAAWAAGALWYNVSWAAPAAIAGTGWMNVVALTQTQPDANQPPWAGIDLLSPELTSLVASQNGNLGISIFDVTHGVQYAANRDAMFTLTSAAKITIMLAYIEQVEKQGHQLSSSDMSALTAMIEQSDNGAAQTLYKAIGSDAGLAAFAQAHGIAFAACKTGWECAKSTPGGMMQTLALVQQGKILNATDRAVVLDLMSHVQADQRWGAGTTAPTGAKVYLKNGWAPNGTNTGWDINTTGIVVTGSQTWIIAVYAQHQPNFDGNPVLLNQACSLVVKALTGK